QVDLALLDERLPVLRDGGDELDLVLGHAQLAGHQLRDLDVEAGVLAVRALEPQPGLVLLDADLQRLLAHDRAATTLLTACCSHGHGGEQGHGDGHSMTESHTGPSSEARRATTALPCA